MMSEHEKWDSRELDEPDPDRVGKPCAHCGAPCEGHHGVHRDGFFMGPELPLCIDCGAYDRPTLDEIWARISHDPDRRTRVSPAVKLDLPLVPSKDALEDAFGCDACGVRRCQEADVIRVKLVGGDYPGIWFISDAKLCETCTNQREVPDVAVQILANMDGELPLKCTIKRHIHVEGMEAAIVYRGLDDWLERRDKRSVSEVQRESMPGVKEKLNLGRSVFQEIEKE